MTQKKQEGFIPEKSMKDKRKIFKQTYIMEAIGLGVISLYLFSMIQAYMYMNPREEWSGALQALPSLIGENPIYFWPITYSMAMPFGFTCLIELFILLGYTIGILKVHANPDTLKGRTSWADVKALTLKYADIIEEKGILPFLKTKNHVKAYNNLMMSKNFWTSMNTKKHFHALNTLILGVSGSGKTRFWLKPNLLQMNCSYAITDPKGEILDSCGELLRRNGYNVKVFDIVELGKCNAYNPMKYCRKESDIKKIVQAFMKNTDTSGGKSGSKDPFWDDSMSAFLCSNIGLLVSKPEGYDVPYAMIPEVTGGVCYQACFANLCELTRMANKKWTPTSGIEIAEGVALGDGKNNTANASELAAIFENLRAFECKRQNCDEDEMEKPYCLREWENFRIAPEKTSTTILMTTAVRLDAFNIEQIKNLTSTDTMNLDDFAKEKTALFLIMPATDRTYNFLLAFLYTQLFDILYQFGEKQVDGSKSLKLASGELIKWFSKEEISNGTAEEEVTKIHNGTIKKVTINGLMHGKEKHGKKHKNISFDDSYYEIYDSDGRKISARQTEQEAKAYLTECKTAKLIPGIVPLLPTHFQFLIDEFPNIGEIPEFKEKLSTMRGYEISATVICQTITQLKGMYPDDYEVIDANCPFTVFLGGDENSNNEYISKKIGSASVKGSNISIDGSKKMSNSYNVEEMKLMNPEDIGRIPYANELVLVYGENPIYDLKFDIVNHRFYKKTKEYLTNCNIDAMNFDRNMYQDISSVTLTFKDTSAMAIPDVQELTPEEFRAAFKAVNMEEALAKAEDCIKRHSFEDESQPMAF